MNPRPTTSFAAVLCPVCAVLLFNFHSSVTYGPTLFISIYFIPLTGAADAASVVTVAAVGKITCACQHAAYDTGYQR